MTFCSCSKFNGPKFMTLNGIGQAIYSHIIKTSPCRWDKKVIINMQSFHMIEYLSEGYQHCDNNNTVLILLLLLPVTDHYTPFKNMYYISHKTFMEHLKFFIAYSVFDD